MRTKKKSLELPDLAMLGISPRPPQPPRRSAPIPIPISPNPNPEAHRRPRNVHDDSRFTVSDMVVQPSTHIPLCPPANNKQQSFSKYDSNNSESSKDSVPPSQLQEEKQSPFLQEIVHSTIPIALHKPLDHSIDDDGKRRHKKEEVPMKIYWRGGGKNVILIRAGDDNWKGRQPMEKESDNVWFAWVNLLPGTHHVRYIVDDQVRISDDLPTAVDDQGSLANYVAIPYSPHPSPNSYGTPHVPTAQRHNSFWSEASSSANFPEKWTNKLPPELLAAAREEEVYLASLSNSMHAQPAPHIPPAPVLPRHLDKLILNTRVATDRDTHRERRRKPTKTRPSLSQSGSDSGTGTHSPASSSQEAIIPVTTASGTDVSATVKQTHPHAMRPTTLKFSNSAGSSNKLDAARLTDDASVLPVPNHVVLHHLSTSAIKNGVLAVADTVRYKKKFITIVYYKPTS